MKVRVITQISGTYDGNAWPARGEEVELPTEQAQFLLDSGFARKVDTKAEKATEPEKAITRKKPETATKKGLTKADLRGDQ